MRRGLFIVFFALLTFEVSGMAALCGDAECDESCPTDVSGGQCSPNCDFCCCCSLPKVAGLAFVALPPLPVRATPWVVRVDRPSSPAPADIVHVPKTVLA